MQNRQHLEAQKLVMLSQHLWLPHDTPPSITSFQTQTFLHLIAGLEVLFQERPASTGNSFNIFRVPPLVLLLLLPTWLVVVRVQPPQGKTTNSCVVER